MNKVVNYRCRRVRNEI